MPNHLANESEHRRGLVLGLTLAEVLILLLFLILLVLGDRLLKVEKALAVLVPNAGSETIDVDSLVSALARQQELEKKVADLKEENAALRTELVKKTQALSAFEKLMSAAKAIEPNDPPAVLQRGLAMVGAAGNGGDQESWNTLVRIISTLGKAQSGMTKEERERFQEALLIFIQSRGATPGHQWPPIIRLSEADDYFFDIGSAELKGDFAQRLAKNIIPEVLKIARDYQVDVIEVVGHTDEQAIAPRASNLDKELFPVLKGQKDVATLIPADNAGLGFIRAVAVMETLRKDQRLSSFRILPLSGAQLIQTDQTLSLGAAQSNNKERRRIEIRMRKAS